MLLLVSGATRTVKRLKGHPCLGRFNTPQAGSRIAGLIEDGLPWALDNGCFCGFEEARFLRMLDGVKAAGGKPLWVAAPDVPCDPAATLKLFEQWEPVIRSYGLPVALVGQGVPERHPVPWDRLDCFFIGGSTEW